MIIVCFILYAKRYKWQVAACAAITTAVVQEWCNSGSYRIAGGIATKKKRRLFPMTDDASHKAQSLACVGHPKSQRSSTSTRSILGTSLVPHWAQCSVRQGYERWHLTQYDTRTFFQRTTRGSLFSVVDFVFIHMGLLELGGLLGAKGGVLGPVVHRRRGQLAVLLQLGAVDLVRGIL